MKDWRIDNEQSSVQHNKVEWNSNEQHSMHLVALLVVQCGYWSDHYFRGVGFCVENIGECESEKKIVDIENRIVDIEKSLVVVETEYWLLMFTTLK